METIDIHTHILFGVDDGAVDMETSLALLDKAYKEGTRRVFFTPHSIDGRFNFDAANRSLEKLVAAAREKFPGLEFSGGCEMYYSESAVESLLQGRVPTLAESKYVLVEFHPTVCYFDLKSAIQKLTVSGFIPIIAHAERYGCLRKESTELLIELGAYIQLNARSVLGKSGLEPKQFCKKLLKSGLVHFIASDAHDLKRRPSGLLACAKYIEKKYSQKYAERIFYKNPMKILNNTYI